MSAPVPARNHDPGAPAQIDFRTLYYTLRERAWLIALCLTLAGLATAAYLVRAPRIYAARAVVQVEQEEQKILKVEGVQQERLQSLEALKTVEQTLQSRALLGRVLDSNNLARDPRFVRTAPSRAAVPAAPPSPLNGERAGVRGERTSDAPAPTREQLITRLDEMVDVRLRRGTRLIDIKVEHPEPALTELIANSIVQEFMRQGQELNANASREANEFLLGEAARLKRKLEESEHALQAYRESMKSASLEDQQNVVVQKLKELGAPVPEVKAEELTEELTAAGNIRCRRCGRIAPKMKEQPFSGEQGQLIHESICAPCWREWIGQGTKVINELRLNLTEKSGQDVYDQHMKEFLNLE